MIIGIGGAGYHMASTIRAAVRQERWSRQLQQREALWLLPSENKLMAHIAMTLAYNADRWGCLSEGSKKEILEFCEEHPSDPDAPFTQDDIDRLRSY